jgi:hypothetical protein
MIERLEKAPMDLAGQFGAGAQPDLPVGEPVLQNPKKLLFRLEGRSQRAAKSQKIFILLCPAKQKGINTIMPCGLADRELVLHIGGRIEVLLGSW